MNTVKDGCQMVEGNESVWWSIIVVAVGNDRAQESTKIVAAGNNSVPCLMMCSGAPC